MVLPSTWLKGFLLQAISMKRQLTVCASDVIDPVYCTKLTLKQLWHAISRVRSRHEMAFLWYFQPVPMQQAKVSPSTASHIFYIHDSLWSLKRNYKCFSHYLSPFTAAARGVKLKPHPHLLCYVLFPNGYIRAHWHWWIRKNKNLRKFSDKDVSAKMWNFITMKFCTHTASNFVTSAIKKLETKLVPIGLFSYSGDLYWFNLSSNK